MGRKSFEAYGALAKSALSPTQQAGRYSNQTKAEGLIAPDVADKLQLGKSDVLVDIGCGPGKITLQLAPLVLHVKAIDHPEIVKRLHAPNLATIGGNFLDLEMTGTATKVLIYSVMHYLSSADEALAFIAKAAALLEPQGRLLVGDLPNVDRKRRFMASEAGKAFDAEWRKNPGEAPRIEDSESYAITDMLLLDWLKDFRARGFDAWVLPQNPELPFGHTREDLLIVRP